MSSWNQFVLSQPNATFFHLAEWKTVLEKAFGFKTYYLYAEQDGQIAAILPLCYIRRPFLGHVMMSTPFCVYGGSIGVSSKLVQELENTAFEMAKQNGARYLELRGGFHEAEQQDAVFFTFRRELPNTVEAALQAIRRKQRAEVRKAIDSQLTFETETTVENHYQIYARSVHALGTPVYPRRYFEVLKSVFGENCRITSVSHGDDQLVSVLTFYFRNEVLPYYAGGLPSARATNAYPFAYWKIMETAINEGASVFDFGRSMRGTGAFSFKKNWGFEPQPLFYRFRSIEGAPLPKIDLENPFFSRLSTVWRRLPLPIANALGPFASRYIS